MKRPPTLTDSALPEKIPSWGVLVLESHHSPRFTMEWRSHAFIKIVYVLSGSGVFRFDQENIGFSAGDVVIVPPRTRNRIEDDPATASSLYVCCISRSLLSFDPGLLPRLSPQRIRGSGHFANRVASTLRRMVHVQHQKQSSATVALAADALRLVQLVLESCDEEKRDSTSSAASGTGQSIQQYVRALETSFFETTSIDEAAAQLGMSRRTFTAAFVKETGVSWLTFTRRLAIEHAKRRLRSSDLPIASVAFECGFNDLSTFYRQFKSQTGMSPAKFRSQ